MQLMIALRTDASDPQCPFPALYPSLHYLILSHRYFLIYSLSATVGFCLMWRERERKHCIIKWIGFLEIRAVQPLKTVIIFEY